MAGEAKKKKRRGLSFRARILMIMGLVMAIVFMPTAIIFTIGMLPTIVSLLVDPGRQKTKSITIGAMNIAGCMPFALQLWTTANTSDHAIHIIIDPHTIIVMYCAAGVGYAIDWAVSGLVGSIMVQAGSLRLQQIVRRQAELIERWGQEVTGDIPIDRQGFPLDHEDSD